jgi:hypothetical protein
MENQVQNNKPRIQVVQKARYIILIPPIAGILFSFWAISEFIFPLSGNEGTRNPPPMWVLIASGFYGFMAIRLLRDMLISKKKYSSISNEQKGLVSLFLGAFLFGVGYYLWFSNFTMLVAIILMDVLPLMEIVVLLQGKTFGESRLYHKDIKIIR